MIRNIRTYRLPIRVPVKRELSANAQIIANLRPPNTGRNGDCVITAISFITGAPYLEVEKLVMEEQKTYSPFHKTKGVYTNQLIGNDRLMFDTIFTSVKDPIYKTAYLGINLRKFIQQHPKGTYLVLINRHAFTVKDGQVYDRCDSSLRCKVHAAWHCEPNH